MVDELGEEERLGRVLADLRGVVGVDRLRRRIVGPGAEGAREQKARQKPPRERAKRHQSGPLVRVGEPPVRSAAYVPVSRSPSAGFSGSVFSDPPVCLTRSIIKE